MAILGLRRWRALARLATVIYLASASPQRALLLTRANIPFQVVRPTCDEDAITAPHPQALALDRARGKAASAIVPEGAVVLGADTVVALGNQVLGSPANQAEAAAMLGRLSGTTHQVYTGHCCICGSHVAIAIASARVTMRPLSQAEIDAYAASGEGIGRAGGYAIQERGDRFVVDLQGAWDTVVGLSIPVVAKLHREVADKPLPGYDSGAYRILR
jgi:septum formation protein